MKGPIKQEIKKEEQSKKRELSGEFMEGNTVERAIKTEMDTRTERGKKSGQALLVYVRHKPQHPHHIKVSARGNTMYRMKLEEYICFVLFSARLFGYCCVFLTEKVCEFLYYPFFPGK